MNRVAIIALCIIFPTLSQCREEQRGIDDSILIGANTGISLMFGRCNIVIGVRQAAHDAVNAMHLDDYSRAHRIVDEMSFHEAECLKLSST